MDGCRMDGVSDANGGAGEPGVMTSDQRREVIGEMDPAAALLAAAASSLAWCRRQRRP